jgi:hypothetical protein
MKIEHAECHAQPAKLDDNVLAFAEFGDTRLPFASSRNRVAS